jgi:hypothetical protein
MPCHHAYYRSDERRERFVSLCHDIDVQRLTFEAYMNKKLVRARSLAHLKIGVTNLLHPAGLVSPARPGAGTSSEVTTPCRAVTSSMIGHISANPSRSSFGRTGQPNSRELTCERLYGSFSPFWAQTPHVKLTIS